MEGQSSNFLLRMLVIITDKPMEKKVSRILEEFRVPIRYQFLGKGTASSEFLEICGLSETSRSIAVGFMQRELVHRVFQALETDLRIEEKGRGIGFTIPVNGIQSSLLKKLVEGQSEMPEEKTDRGESDMKDGSSYAMILVTCTLGYSAEVMEAARGAGASGGTIMKCRHQGTEEPMSFMGVSIQEEQEAVSILVKKSIKKNVMQAISETCGFQTPAKAMVMSLPVDEVIGLL